MKYTHDIAHCNGGDCPKRNECYRYLAHVEAQEKNLGYLSYLINPKENCYALDKNSPKNLEWNKKYPNSQRIQFSAFWDINLL